MDRYQILNAASRIDGYYQPAPHEVALKKHAEAFERAKSETLKNMKDALAQTEALTAEQFFVYRKNAGKVEA